MANKRYCPAAVAWTADKPIYVTGGNQDSDSENPDGLILDTTEFFDAEQQAWEAGPKMKTRRSNHTAVSLRPGENIYVLGGCDEEEAWLDTVERYSVTSNTWELVPNMVMREKRLHSAAAVLDGRIYITGGMSDPSQVATNSVEYFDVATNTWQEVAPLNTPRHSHAAVVFNGVLFVIGGKDDRRKVLKSVECYSVTHNAWREVASLNTGRCSLAAVVL